MGAKVTKPKRSLDDVEVGLIRAMLNRGMSKTQVQAYFTHPDRPVNFGRITNIADGNYGKGIGPVTDAELDLFLQTWKDRRGSSVTAIVGSVLDLNSLPLTDERRIRSHFVRQGAVWSTVGGETDLIECKKSFSLKSKILKAVCALANNRGGYVFFGVDDDKKVVGLTTNHFHETDPSKITQALRAAFEPMPRVETRSLEIGGLKVGVFCVHAELDGPIIATRTDEDIKEGAVYYRYPGESRGIGGAEFRRMLADRDRRSREASGTTIAKVLELGSRAAIVDLASDSPTATKIVREGIDDADVLRNFVRQETVEFPVAYLLRSCATTKSWLPVFYYVQLAGLALSDATKIVEQKETSYVARKQDLLLRLAGSKSAFIKLAGKAGKLRDEISSGTNPPPSTTKIAGDLALAMSGLKRADRDLGSLILLLKGIIDQTKADPDAKPILWSYIYKAAARIDELYFRPS
jgi:hypothetical protein